MKLTQDEDKNSSDRKAEPPCFAIAAIFCFGMLIADADIQYRKKAAIPYDVSHILDPIWQFTILMNDAVLRSSEGDVLPRLRDGQACCFRLSPAFISGMYRCISVIRIRFFSGDMLLF